MNSSAEPAHGGVPSKPAISFLHLERLPRVLYYLAIFGLVAYAGLYIAHAIVSILYPYQLDYGEGFLLLFSSEIAQGQNIYHHLTDYPYVPVIYTPLYTLICAAFFKVTGVTFAVGRAVSVGSAVLIGALVYLILRRDAGKTVAMIAALFLFASPAVYWTSLFRVDALGLMFSLAGLYCIHRNEDGNGVYVSAILFFLAIMTKQSFVAAPAAAFVYLLLRNKKSAIVMFFSLGLLVASAFVLLDVSTHREFLYNVVTLQAWPVSLVRTEALYIGFLQIHSILFVSALGMAVFMIIRDKKSLFAYYLLTSAIVALTVGRLGSDVNYFLEVIVASTILFGMLLKEIDIGAAVRQANLVGCFAVAALVVQLAIFYHGAAVPTLDNMKSQRTVTQLVAQVHGDVLAEDVGPLVMDHQTVFIAFFEMTQLDKEGVWDQSEFIRDLDNKKFSMIILDASNGNSVNAARFTPQMLDSISKNYQLADKIGEYLILVRTAQPQG